MQENREHPQQTVHFQRFFLWVLGVALSGLERVKCFKAFSSLVWFDLLCQLWPFLEQKDLATITHTLVTSSSINATYSTWGCLCKWLQLPWKLELVQNDTAHMLLRASKFLHATPVLWE